MGKAHCKARDRSQRRQRVRAGRRPLELALADYYRRQGYTVTRLEHDQSTREFDGIDLLLRLGDRFVVVACRDRLPPLFHHEIQALHRRLPRLGANGLIVASLDAFDPRARELGDHFPDLQLIDGALLRILLGDAAADTLQREQESARATYPAAPACRPPRRRLLPAMGVAALVLLLLVAWLGWRAGRTNAATVHDADGEPSHASGS